MDKYEIKITSDGSHTIYLPELDETYHSIHGAIQEAKHVFIDAGLYYFEKGTKIRILEIGFGTGLNAFLTFLESKNTICDYTGVEAFPVTKELIEKINYLDQVDVTEQDREVYFKMHELPWKEQHIITDRYQFTKICTKVDKFETTKRFNLIYFDAFGPRVQPEMWEEDILKRMYDVLENGGVLVTYCAKGSVKRALKKVGFEVEALPGPPGKREMTRAIKK